MKTSLFLFASTLVTASLLSSAPATASSPTPVVVFPAYHFSVLEVEVKNQHQFPECPANGTFEFYFPNTNPSPIFSTECQDKLLSMRLDPNPAKPMSKRFSNQKHVKVRIKHDGKTENAPFYEPLFAFLEANGWERNQNIRVAGYDARLTPDMNDFVKRTKKLIEKTYHQNGNTPVHLVGHSNGPLYTQYLLTNTSQAWKDKYVHGFTPLAGNWPGQGFFYTVFFTGFNIADFFFPADAAGAAASAARYQTQPSSYMSSADPAYFGNQEVIFKNGTTGVEYTPAEAFDLFADANMTLAQEIAPHYFGFVEFEPPAYPNVDVYLEKGSGVPTLVGVELPDFTIGQVFVDQPIYLRDGDGNQEDLTNDAAEIWQTMPCFRFESTDNPGIDHFSLASNADVFDRLLTNLGRTKSSCP